jgi:hypothetical protein
LEKSKSESCIVWQICLEKDGAEKRRRMKITNIPDINDFFKVVDKCKGRVELTSSEGDRINLKSKLTQFVAMAQLMNTTYVKELEIVASEPEDANRLLDYMMKGKI